MTNFDTTVYAQMLVQATDDYNASPRAGIAFSVKYNSAAAYTAGGCSIQSFKENSTDGDFSTGLLFTTQGNGVAPSEKMRLDFGGKLLLGVTSSTGLSNGDFAMANGNHIRFRNAANSAYISAFEFTSANGLNIGTGGSLYNITFGISGIGEVARFNNGTGYLGLFNQNPGAMLDVGPTTGASQVAAILRGGSGLGNTGGLGLYTNDVSATARNWGLVSNSSAYGDFSIRQGTSIGANPLSAGVDRLYISNGGQVVINNGSTVVDTALLTVSCTAGTGSTTPLSLRVGVDSDGYTALTFRNQSGIQGGITCNTTSISMSGVSGITFKATQVPSADANTLDDYEEGTWTPVLTDGVNSVASYFYQYGSYIKVGRIVTINCTISVFNKGSLGAGDVFITGLPFTSGILNSGFEENMLAAKIFPLGSDKYGVGSIGTGVTRINPFTVLSGGASFVQGGNVGAGSQLMFTGTYWSAS
jgi:hypothetical protein